MTSNEERREVAARLRAARENLEKIPVPRDIHEASFIYLCELTKAIGKHDGKLFNCLADLIEPEPERTCKMELVKSGLIYNVWRFSCCGYEHSENVTDGGATELPGTRCPKCGTKVDDD